jgi:hypothetical protein
MLCNEGAVLGTINMNVRVTIAWNMPLTMRAIYGRAACKEKKEFSCTIN